MDIQYLIQKINGLSFLKDSSPLTHSGNYEGGGHSFAPAKTTPPLTLLYEAPKTMKVDFEGNHNFSFLLLVAFYL